MAINRFFEIKWIIAKLEKKKKTFREDGKLNIKESKGMKILWKKKKIKKKFRLKNIP